MGAASGIALRGLQFFIRGILFCCAAIVLALFAYFLATLSNHNMHIGTWVKAVTGISGIAVIYTILALLMLCCCAGRSFPSFILMVLDLAFAGAFIYIAVANRHGASSCNGEVNTVFGKGDADTNVRDNGSGGFTALPSLRQACQMETACLAVSIVAVILFALAPLITLALVRHRKKENRIGPSPANNYTEGYGGRKRFGFFGRKRAPAAASHNPNVLPEHSTPDQLRQSYATEQTRVGSSGAGYGGLGSGTNKYEPPHGNTADNIPMENYGNATGPGYRYENNGGVFR